MSDQDHHHRPPKTTTAISSFKPTPSQKIAWQKFNDFMSKPVSSDPYKRIFVLKGKGGTGKTTIIKHVLVNHLKIDEGIDVDDPFLASFSNFSVIGITVAHKAKKVLKKSIPICTTFAACYGLKQFHNHDGTISFVKEKRTPHSPQLLCEAEPLAFIFDEASMVSKGMLQVILTHTNPRSKIIFMGDPGQLPPIEEANTLIIPDEDSPVFRLPIPPDHMAELIERKRQASNNPILELSDIIYEEIFGTQNMQRVYDAMSRSILVGSEGFELLHNMDFLDHYRSFCTDYTQSKVIAYTNARVDGYNQLIRNYLYGNPGIEYIPNELIVMKDTYHNVDSSAGRKPLVNWTCYNSDEYRIQTTDMAMVNNLLCALLYIDKEGHDHFQDDCEPFIPMLISESRPEYNRILSILHSAALQADVKTKSQKFKHYWDYVKKFGNVNYAYAFTGHKAQGSGYDNIYVDVNNILTLGVISPKRKLQALYTAITRAKKNVHLLTARNDVRGNYRKSYSGASVPQIEDKPHLLT